MKNAVKRVGMFLMNWAFMLSVPVWGGCAFVVMWIYESIQHAAIERKVALGAKPFWEM